MRSFLEIANFPFSQFKSVEWREWESVAKSLPELIENGEIRQIVDGLPEVKLDALEGNEIKRAYTVVTFIAHSYIRGDLLSEVIKVLPEKISKIWIEVGNSLGVPPVATYSATVLFNFKGGREFKEPEDFEIEFTFTGTEDEKWFYAVSAAIDVQSELIMKCVDKMAEDNCDFDEIGNEIKKAIEEMTRILNRMYEKCRPEVFYGQVRKYLAGWLNDPQLPEGLFYESHGKLMKLAGGSAAQNPTVQLLDILLGVKHGEDTEDLMISGYNGGGCPRMNYLGAMRTYMPKEHSEYLNSLETKMPFVIELFKKSCGYDSCVEALAAFRSEHIKMVVRYIVSQSKSGCPLGTGGSNPIPFLKKCRYETEQCLKK